MFMYLKGAVRPGDRVLHVAPEEALQKSIRRLPGVFYTSADLRSPFADIKVDLDSDADVQAKLECGSYTIVVISHVLEHVRDDREVARRLVDLVGSVGKVLVQVPVALENEDTYEDWSITSPEGRRRAFGQEDHVRLYGRDIVGRLESAGVEVRPVEPGDLFTPEKQARARLAGDTIYVLSQRPPSQDV